MHPAKFAVLAFFSLAAVAVGVGAMLAAGNSSTAAAIDQAYTNPTPKAVAVAPPAHRWVVRQNGGYGYQRAMSENDAAAGLATKSLTMITYNGVVQGDYSFTTYNPVTGNAIIMRCAEPCEFMRVMNYDHRVPETFPVTPGSLMEAIVQDARAGFLSP